MNIKAEIKKKLIGLEFNESSYAEEVSKLLQNLDVEVNTTDFDIDRIYKKGYEGSDNWDEHYICSLDVSFPDECTIKIEDIY